MPSLHGFSDAELVRAESSRAIETDLLAWVTGAEVPVEHDTAMFRRVRDFHFKAEDQVSAMAKSPAELLAPGRPLTFANVADGAEGLVISDLARSDCRAPPAAGDERW